MRAQFYRCVLIKIIALDLITADVSGIEYQSRRLSEFPFIIWVVRISNEFVFGSFIKAV